MRRDHLLMRDTVVQCEAEGCDSAKANYYELQTRSADEPMTKFLRVGWARELEAHVQLTPRTVRQVPPRVERVLRLSYNNRKSQELPRLEWIPGETLV